MKQNLLSKIAVLVWLIFTTTLAFSIDNHVRGKVFYDENSDSTYNGSDTGIAGVKLLLHKDVNDNDILDAGDVLLQETYTLLGGNYGFFFPYDDDHKELLVTVDTSTMADSIIPMGPITKKFTYTYSGMCLNNVNFGFQFGECLLYPGNVVYYKKGMPPCEPCEGGLYKMVVRLADPAYTQKVKVEIKVSGSTVFTDSLEPGGLMIVMYPDSSKIPNDLEFYINGTLNGSVHTSCSQPIGPGMDFGSFEIFRVYSVDYAPICPPENGDCSECEGGMNEITFKYNGPLSSPKIKITDKNGTLFDDYVDQGEMFTIYGPSGSRMGNEIKIYIKNCFHTDLHTSCSKPIYAGMAVGDLILVSGKSVKGGYLCTFDEPNGGDDCGKCNKEVKSLTLKYIGSLSNPKIAIKKGKKKYYNQTVAKNTNFTIVPQGKDKKLPKDLYFYVNCKKKLKYKFDCSRPVSPGTIFGDFEIVAATTKGDKEICDSDDTTTNNGTCDECKGGVKYIQFQYAGSSKVKIKLIGGSTTYYNDSVAPNGLLAIGSTTGSKLEKDVEIFVNGVFHSKIHTSCSKPIGPGVRAGDLIITISHSVDNGLICDETPPSGCIGCTDELKAVTLRYDGTSTNLHIEIKEGGDKVYDGYVNPGDVFTVYPDHAHGFHDEIEIKVGKKKIAEFTVDCSSPMGAGTTNGDFTVVSGIHKNGQVLCDLDVTDCGECEGGLSTLSVRYEGTATKTVKIVGKSTVYFNASVAPGTIITISKGPSDKRIVNEIDLYINNVKNTSIHTSCSQPIYPGLNFGSFLVTAAVSNKGGEICPKEPFCLGPDTTNLSYILGAPDDLGTLLTSGAEIIVDLIDTLLANKSYNIRAALEGTNSGTVKLDIYESLNGITYSAVKHITVSSTTYTDFTLTTNAKTRYIVIQNHDKKGCVNIDAIIYDCGSVPVELFSFEGFILDAEHAKLLWQTSLEIDNEKFIIERRYEHQDAFVSVGEVEGVGNSIDINSYDYVDNLKGYLSGNIYYRLRQVDFSGHYEYSNTIVLGLLDRDEIVVAPNPALRETTVVFPQNKSMRNYSIEIFNMAGLEVTEQVASTKGDHMIDLNFGNMAGGFYFVKIQNGEKITTKKIMIK